MTEDGRLTRTPVPSRADRVITGTKDNQLLVWDVKVDRHVCLPSYISEGWRVDHCGIHSIAISPQGVIASGGQAPQVSARDAHAPSPKSQLLVPLVLIVSTRRRTLAGHPPPRPRNLSASVAAQGA